MIDYKTTERVVKVFGRLTAAQYDRYCYLINVGTGQFQPWLERRRFDPTTDADLLALQDYLVEQKLAHEIATTRRWNP